MLHTQQPIDNLNNYLGDFSTVAGLYSQLTGVLAGFAFAALVTVISVRLTVVGSSTDRLTSIYASLMSAFLALVATSLNYAVVAADQSNSSRTAFLETSSGVGFVAAGVMLIYSILLLLRVVEGDPSSATNATTRAVKLVERVHIVGVCPLALTMFVGAIRDHALVKYGLDIGIQWPEVVGFVIIAWSILFGILLFRYRMSMLVKLAISATRRSWLITSAVIIAIVSVALTTLTFSYFPLEGTTSNLVPFAELLVVAAFITLAQLVAIDGGVDEA